MTARQLVALLLIVFVAIYLLMVDTPAPRTPQPEAVSKPKPEDVSKETQQERNIRMSK